jgi:hypothetical protein
MSCLTRFSPFKKKKKICMPLSGDILRENFLTSKIQEIAELTAI